MAKVQCPVCGAYGVRPSGPSTAKVLIVGEFPGRAELERGMPFATHPMYITAGKVLRKEMERMGLSLNQFRVMNLWLHEPTENQECYQTGFNAVLDEAKGKKVILLVGSDVVEAFTKFKVSDVNGLQVESPILSASIIYAMMNPAQVFHRGIGEIRLAIEKFAARLEKEGLA